MTTGNVAAQRIQEGERRRAAGAGTWRRRRPRQRRLMTRQQGDAGESTRCWTWPEAEEAAAFADTGFGGDAARGRRRRSPVHGGREGAERLETEREKETVRGVATLAWFGSRWHSAEGRSGEGEQDGRGGALWWLACSGTGGLGHEVWLDSTERKTSRDEVRGDEGGSCSAAEEASAAEAVAVSHPGAGAGWLQERSSVGGGAVCGSIGQGRMRDGSRCGFGVAATEKDGWDISLKFRVLV